MWSNYLEGGPRAWRRDANLADRAEELVAYVLSGDFAAARSGDQPEWHHPGAPVIPRRARRSHAVKRADFDLFVAAGLWAVALDDVVADDSHDQALRETFAQADWKLLTRALSLEDRVAVALAAAGELLAAVEEALDDDGQAPAPAPFCKRIVHTTASGAGVLRAPPTRTNAPLAASGSLV